MYDEYCVDKHFLSKNEIFLNLLLIVTQNYPGVVTFTQVEKLAYLQFIWFKIISVFKSF